MVEKLGHQPQDSPELYLLRHPREPFSHEMWTPACSWLPGYFQSLTALLSPGFPHLCLVSASFMGSSLCHNPLTLALFRWLPPFLTVSSENILPLRFHYHISLSAWLCLQPRVHQCEASACFFLRPLNSCLQPRLLSCCLHIVLLFRSLFY